MVWCYLSSWVVQDGQLPDITIGTLLSTVGVSIRGHLTAGAAPLTPGVTLIESSGDNDDAYRYRVVGEAGSAYEVGSAMGAEETISPVYLFAEFVLTCGPLRFTAQAHGVRASQLAAGSLVSIDGPLRVMAEHEFDLTDGGGEIRRNWIVAGIQVERYDVVWREVVVPDGVAWEGRPGRRLDLVELDRIEPRLDERRFATERAEGSGLSIDFAYVLDLEPAT